MTTQTQTQVIDPGQVAAATAGQQVQQLIVPQEDWPAYVEYIKQRHPDVQATVTPITAEQVKANVEAGTAVQLPPQAGVMLKNLAYGFDPKKMGSITPPPNYYSSSKEESKPQAPTGAQPQQTTTTATAAGGNTFAGQAVKYDPEQAGIPGVIKGLSKMLMNYAQEEMKMENQNNNNAQAAQGQVQQAAAGIQMPQVSWGSIAKGAGLAGGGILLGRYVFGKNPAPAETGEALMSAAKTLGDADPKAIAGAVGSIAKGLMGKVFGV